MRNTTFIFLVIFLTFLFVACGNDNSTTDENQEIVQLKGHEELDLNQWGFPMVIMVPDASGTIITIGKPHWFKSNSS